MSFLIFNIVGYVMNLENLQTAVDYLKANGSDIGRRFNMRRFRLNHQHAYVMICPSVGCLLGHLTVCDSENIKSNYYSERYGIEFLFWGSNWFGVKIHSKLWNFIFGHGWGYSRNGNTLDQAIKRIEYVIKHKVTPCNWNYGYIL